MTMPRIVTALFKDQAQAHQALQSLLEMGIAQSRITTAGMNEGREVSSISGFRTLDIPEDSRASLNGLGLPAEDTRLFEQGLRRGCSLIAAGVDAENFDEAIRVLEMFDPVDLDRDSREWAKEHAGESGGDAATVGGPLGAGLTGGSTAGMTNTSTLPGMGQMAEGSDDLGTADLRMDETAQAAPTGERRGDERANREGVNELTGNTNPAPGGETAPLQRQMHRGGRIWVFGSTESGGL